VFLHDGHAILADFGLSALQEEIQNDGHLGNTYHRAFEVETFAPTFTNKIDIWGFGCIMAQVLKGDVLFDSDSSQERIQKMLKLFDEDGTVGRPLGYRHLFDQNGLQSEMGPMSSECESLLRGVFNLDPEQRLTACEIILHEFFDSLWSQSGFKAKYGDALRKVGAHGDEEGKEAMNKDTTCFPAAVKEENEVKEEEEVEEIIEEGCILVEIAAEAEGAEEGGIMNGGDDRQGELDGEQREVQESAQGEEGVAEDQAFIWAQENEEENVDEVYILASYEGHVPSGGLEDDCSQGEPAMDEEEACVPEC
jgi:hypothetical protein